MKKLISLSMLAGLVGLSVAATAPRAEAQIVANFSLGTSVAIACQNPGSHQDVAKTPVLKNTQSSPIPKGKVLYWKSSDGDSGSVKLVADLAPGATIKAMGTAGNGYSCTSQFIAKPDLAIQQALWSSQTAVTVKVANLDKFVGAGVSTVRLEVMSCSGAVLQTVDVPAGAIAQGGAVTLSIAAKYPSGKSYLRVRADATSKISEGSETNNVWDTQNSCIS